MRIRSKPAAGLAALLAVTALAAADGTPAATAARQPRTATFEVRDSFAIRKIPAGTKKLRCWFEVPQEDPQQTIRDLKVEAPAPTTTPRSEETGTRFLYMELDDPKGDVSVSTRYTVERRELLSPLSGSRTSPVTPEVKSSHARYLRAEGYVTVDDSTRKLAREVVGNETDPAAAARKIYDYVIGHCEYWKKDKTKYKPSGLGSTVYALEQCTGNCTDFHALFISLARSAGIPARFTMGVGLSKEMDGKDEDVGYHCWAEVFLPGAGWTAVDASYADMQPDKADYYFGNLDERRIVLSYGRDFDLAPRQGGARSNFFIKLYVEADGKPLDAVARKLTYKELPAKK